MNIFNRDIKKTSSLCLICVMILFFLSCGTTKSVTNRNYDYSRLKKIAIFPLTGHAVYAEYLTKDVGLYVIEAGCRVIEVHRIEKILLEQTLKQPSLTGEDQMIQIGKLLGADAIITGSVVPRSVKVNWRNQHYMKEGIGNAQIRIVDVETGSLIGDVSFDNGSNYISFQTLQTTTETIGKEIIRSIKPTK
jgi:hypothetical protein